MSCVRSDLLTLDGSTVTALGGVERDIAVAAALAVAVVTVATAAVMLAAMVVEVWVGVALGTSS